MIFKVAIPQRKPPYIDINLLNKVTRMNKEGKKDEKRRRFSLFFFQRRVIFNHFKSFLILFLIFFLTFFHLILD